MILKKWQSAHFAKAVVRQDGPTWSIFLAELQSTKYARIKGNYPVVGSWSKILCQGGDLANLQAYKVVANVV